MTLCFRAPRLLQLWSLCLAAILCAAPAYGWQTEEEEGPDGIDPTELQPDGTIDFGEEVIVRVEEDWLLDIAVTDQNSTAPEIVTTFGPHNPYTGLHAVFEMNHTTYPSFQKGGMQMQAWWGPWFIGSKRHPNSSEMLTTVERVQYTACTRVANNVVTMEIKNGDSITYGTFGGDRYLRLRLWTNVQNLNNYHPQSSIAHSRVTFGANRVNRFLRTEIRYYTADGDVITDETDTYVHQLVAADQGPAPINE